MTTKPKGGNGDLLFRAILELKTMEECRRFFDNVCTVQELNTMTQRVVVARMLLDKCVYNEIAEQTGASTATISRVKRSLEYGGDVYQTVFARLEEGQESKS